MQERIKPFHVGIAAEAFVAAQFARCGYNVLVQYGANQPEYDLVVVKIKDGKSMNVSVKGSQDGAWGLTQSFLKNADYHGAVDKWLEKHHKKTVFAFVQFLDVPLYEMPRLYLAFPKEIAAVLKSSAKDRGDTILYEEKKRGARAYGSGTIDKIPDEWKFSRERIEEILDHI